MIEHNAQQPGTNPAPVKSNTPEEGSELVEEADQRSQDTHMQAFSAQRKNQIGHHLYWIARDHFERSPFPFHGIYRCTVCNDSISTLVL